MGQMAANIASSYADLGELVIADIDLQAAERVVAELAPSAKTSLRAACIDVTDAAALRALLEEAQVVLNTTGPFYRLGTAVLEASISARCHYIDICDDWEPTTKLLSFNDQAKAAGVLAIVGLGASPGCSNLLARVACDRLDQVDDLYTAWPIDAGAGEFSLEGEGTKGTEPSAAIVHWVQQISGSIEVVEKGQLVSRPPQVPVTIDYPNLGKGTAYTVGHPEPITLHERMNVRGSSANLMVLKRSTAAYLDRVRKEIDSGQLSAKDAAIELMKRRTPRLLRALFRSLTMEGAGALPGFFAFAQGERDGQALRIGVHVNAMPDDMAAATSTPLALGLRQLLDGRLDMTGAHPPEAVIDLEPFFDGFARACNPPLASMGELVVVNEAPAS
jgi:saccharopine dehydrogenase-like NADP-dependent oxidoreductase